MSEKLRGELFWTDRWISSSAFLLPLEARGLYREMLTRAWSFGGYLPSDHEQIKRLVNASDAEWKRCWPLIEANWQTFGSKISNATQLEVMAESLSIREKRALAGRKGGLASGKTRSKPSKKIEATPQANPKQTKQPSPEPSLSLSLEQPKDPNDDGRTDSSAVADQRETIRRIFDGWKRLFALDGRVKLTDMRKGKIRARLRDSTFEEIEAALKGWASDPWRHESFQRHDLACLLRNREQVEKGMACGEKKPMTKAERDQADMIDAIRQAEEDDNAYQASLQREYGDAGGGKG